MRANGDDLLDAGQLLADAGDRVEKVRSGDQHLRAGVVDDVGDLCRRQAPVDGDDDRVELGRAEGDLEVLQAVLGQEGDAILTADAVALQGGSRTVRALVEFAPAHAAAAEFYGGTLGCLRSEPPHNIGNSTLRHRRLPMASARL